MKIALEELLRRRVVILDGAYGTMAPGDESAVSALHGAYIEAGADVIKTHSFLLKTGGEALDGYRRATALARAAADQAGRPCFVAGALGPAHGPEAEKLDLPKAYADAAEALMAGGADLVLIETLFDGRIVRAALAGIAGRYPVAVSATVGRDGRLPSGETLADFCAAIRPARPLAVGLNCGFGPSAMADALRALATCADWPISAHPNAGVPDALGPAAFAEIVAGWARAGAVRMVGGCCGTTPAHIAALAAELARTG